MKFPARYLIPVVAAVLLAGGVLGFAWWQLSTVQLRLQERVRSLAEEQDTLDRSGSGATVQEDPLDAGDVVLIHLRQGDLLGLQGDWAGAEKEYQMSVDAGGGISIAAKAPV